ncbi:MAG: FAD-dependent oxidoreductase [Patescibacteria group bacterium]|jgi:uncharacterized FAD-dependent dehydrogenase
MKLYDLIIIGAGPAGVSAAKVAVDKGLSVLILERGKDLAKRRDLISGWFGKGIIDVDRFELEDILLDNQKAVKEALKIVKKVASTQIKNINKNKIHRFSPKFGVNMAAFFFDKLQKKVDIFFNSEVLKVEQSEQNFIVYTIKNVFMGHYCLISTGKYSIEWIKNLCSDFNIDLLNNNIKIGVRIEVPTSKVIDFLETGNINVSDGSTSIEDTRFDSFVGEWEEANILSAFGHSILNKESHKTNFMVGISTKTVIDEVIREIKIVNILANDRIKCERVFDYMEGKSLVKHIGIFDDLRIAFEKLDTILPFFSTYAIMYIPEVRLNGILPVTSSMETSIPGLYGAGECTSRVSNLVGAMASGIIATKTIAKE